MTRRGFLLAQLVYGSDCHGLSSLSCNGGGGKRRKTMATSLIDGGGVKGKTVAFIQVTGNAFFESANKGAQKSKEWGFTVDLYQ